MADADDGVVGDATQPTRSTTPVLSAQESEVEGKSESVHRLSTSLDSTSSPVVPPATPEGVDEHDPALTPTPPTIVTSTEEEDDCPLESTDASTATSTATDGLSSKLEGASPDALQAESVQAASRKGDRTPKSRGRRGRKSPQQLTAGQIAGFRKVFEFIDETKNGLLEPDEIFSQAKAMGINITLEQAKETTKVRQDNAELSFDQFLSVLTCDDT